VERVRNMLEKRLKHASLEISARRTSAQSTQKAVCTLCVINDTLLCVSCGGRSIGWGGTGKRFSFI
jgi:hypothetical protein